MNNEVKTTVRFHSKLRIDGIKKLIIPRLGKCIKQICHWQKKCYSFAKHWQFLTQLIILIIFTRHRCVTQINLQEKTHHPVVTSAFN